jgi:uncharacterized repeat protein (TIGR03803 family)
MKDSKLGRYALFGCVAAALLPGCGGSQPPIGVPGALPHAAGAAPARTGHRWSASSYQVLYSFHEGQFHGRYPESALTYVNGALYGTTSGGGNGCPGGCGTVYRMSPSGTEKVLYSFHGGSSDGANPVATLIDVNGTLYGTTEYGGGGCPDLGCGTVYSISTTGTETMLHSFADRSSDDGYSPLAGLIDVNGTLYGTTKYGGANCEGFLGCGTVYSISTSGSEKVIFSFGGSPDGAWPVSGLINVKGILYGTTSVGGSSGDGTVYSITPTGTEKVLHSFGGSPDGAMPGSGLVDVRGTLYGTTSSGGNALCYEVSSTCGIVYSITTTGKEKVFYTFGPASDYGGGAAPSAGLVYLNGVLYGTAPVGGNGYGCYNIGCGVVYSLTMTAQETVLHVFNGGSDGARPDSAMIDVNGTLYGTTPSGGSLKCDHHHGCGTVFSLSP